MIYVQLIVGYAGIANLFAKSFKLAHRFNMWSSATARNPLEWKEPTVFLDFAIDFRDIGLVHIKHHFFQHLVIYLDEIELSLSGKKDSNIYLQVDASVLLLD